MDFVHDTLGDGRAFRILTVVDDFTRACPLIAVDVALPAGRITGLLDQLADMRPLPAALVCDNGSEFTSVAFNQWAHQRRIALHFIRPGTPVENAYAESFNGKLRDEMPERELVCQLGRCAAYHRGLADRVQHRPAARRGGWSKPGRVCAAAQSRRAPQSL
jgi:putative transposase